VAGSSTPAIAGLVRPLLKGKGEELRREAELWRATKKTQMTLRRLERKEQLKQQRKALAKQAREAAKQAEMNR
jgi:hypothetical protein